MKITAEFNSNEELLNFINTFGTTTNIIEKIEPKQVGQAPKEKKEAIKETPKKEVKKDIKKEESKSVDPPKQDTKKEKNPAAEQTKKEDKPVEEPKTEITKEMVRAIFTKLIQAGKQKEAKEITAKYGASKLPELKEEHYAAVIKEVEELL
ncbi:hypothetical protein [Clostridium sporogenes]|uniref:hypothetical protein n=1 Tax=Clostridium sporogenes TaxID=1509 RepID=UPI0005F07176|nr:hypothetical protein [Clostridium sporogenes]MCW6061587.1 hypothetical protein [Clostridium sporogenes]MCW6069779.1 hypothetical protein [Clostridium sporogenes]MCW6122508.1 hypothetical protein [Clostridium sporogenes]MDS1006097.1 hypothetical protein [Clostridium sporogenes]MDU6336999.1 hypothetical protein [Clostridium sporogenes]